MDTRRRTPRPGVAAPLTLLVAVALSLTACAPGAALELQLGPGTSASIELTPVLRAGVLVISIPAERPSGGVTVRADGRRFHIPPGHDPPPGQCRIWNPDRPPGLQDPPGQCDRLERQVPPGSYLVVG